MDTALSSSDADWRAQAATERAHREQAEAALVVAQARLDTLEQKLAATNNHAQRHHTQLTALVQMLQVGMVLVDEEGQIQFVNQQFWEMFGLTPVAGPAEGAPPIPVAAVVIDPVFRDPVAFETRARALHATGQTTLQEEFTLADGRVVELDYLVLDDVRAGRLICYRDVTERHQRETQLRTLAYIPEQNPNPILRLTAAGEVIYANPAAAPLLQALATDAHGALHQQFLGMVHATLNNPAQHQQELALAGQYYLCTATAVPGETYVTLYLTNITERRQMEQQLAGQQSFYESVLEQVPTAVAVFDAEHRYLFLNPAVEPDPATRTWMLGKTSDEGCAYRQRRPGITQQRREAFQQAVREQREVTWEETNSGHSGDKHLLLRVRPMWGADGTLRVISSGVDITELKRAEARTTQQQEFYESILNLLPVDVAVFDAEHRFLFVNPSSISDPQVRQQIIGLTNKEYFILRNKQQPSGTVEQREQYFDLAVRTAKDVSWEEMRPGPGRPKLILRHLRPIFSADGTLRMVVGSGIDITARYVAENLQHQVQELLQEQQIFIRQVVDTLPNVLYVIEPDGHASFANKAYNELVANTHHWFPDKATPAVREEMEQIMALSQQVRTTRQALTKEMPFTLINGETIYYQVHKRPMLRANGQLGVLTISTDVTAIKQARQELERREKQYHDLVYYSQTLICTHDMRGNLLSVNPAIERLMGVPAAQLVGHNLREALPTTLHSALRAYLVSDIQPQAQPRVITIQTAAGDLRYLHYYTYRVTEEGYPPYVVASGYDVTEGVLAQQALEYAKQEADENAQAKESFLARMSHEIRTPLNGVLGMAGLLQKTELTTPQREYLTTMQHAGRHLLALLNDVLDMAKITTQHLELDHAPFDLAVALHGAGQTVAALAEQKGLALTVEPLPVASPRVLGDAYRLHQVLLNLLSNAIKFTEQGNVRLGATVLRDTPHELVLRFWVEDTGIGIAPEQQAHIFEAFTQASAETSSRFGGTGLGLAISQQLVSQMGGVLRLCSEPGIGTTFAFQLVLPRPDETVAAQELLPAEASYEGLRGLRVLLAEDNIVNQWIAVVVLEHWGVQVQAVDNGTDALAYLSENVYDLAILDIQMPGLSGVEVTVAIRQHHDAVRAAIPIIALTANAFEADRIGYLAAGMNACLTKPYEEADLCQLLLDLTVGASAAGE